MSSHMFAKRILHNVLYKQQNQFCFPEDISFSNYRSLERPTFHHLSSGSEENALLCIRVPPPNKLDAILDAFPTMSRLTLPDPIFLQFMRIFYLKSHQ